jgi:Rieske 2Fe-2S family protein
MLWLKYRHGVYFPWKVAYHLLENVLWEDKHSGEGKSFRHEARRVFPETVAFVEGLPFREIGRAVLFGLESNDHAPLHRDTAPGSKAPRDVDHTITICPRGDKRFYLCDPELRTKVHVGARLYWFNDMDWHGVEPDPFFRYSIRVDGVFEPAFVSTLEEHVATRVGARHTC